MNDQPFPIGTVVTLKSGGPDMTVTDANGEHRTCLWMDAKGEPQEADFHHATLQAAQKRPTRLVRG